MPSSGSYDLIIIGGGSGGSSTAKRAAEYGAKVVIIERGATYDANGVRHGAGNGGTCVNVGCVPKKLMFMAAQHREAMHGSVSTAAGYGFSVPESAAEFDWAGVKQRRDAYVRRLTTTYKGGWEKAGCEVLQGLASFDSPTQVTVALNEGGSCTLTAPKILVACGGRPSTLPIPGAEHGITSDGFFDLEVQPEKAVVLGAGYIAVEMAGILHGLGTETHLCFRGDTVLRRGFDTFIVETLMAHMADHGPILKPGATPARVDLDPQTGLKTVTFEDGTTISGVDCVLFATGRTPVTDLLRMENTGVKLEKGYIAVDKKEATNVPSIFAIGDVTTTGFELTPVAIAAGRRLADRLFGGEPNTGAKNAFFGAISY
jgi:glutathione reductase (NADPH)